MVCTERHTPSAGPAECPLAALLGRAIRGDRAAWDLIVGRHRSVVRGIAAGYRLDPADADDIEQLTWLTLHQHAGRLRDPDRLGGWLAAVARHHSIALLRARRRELPTPQVQVDVATTDGALLPEPAVLGAADEALVRAAVATLPARCRWLLIAWSGRPDLGREQLAALAGVAEPSLGRTRSRCLAELRRRLDKLGLRDLT
jgi:RNA polymerase sigma factor (sigma-70 family)